MSGPEFMGNPARPEPTFRTFEDLEVYKTSREFRKAMYRVARRLPDFEKFGLASQVRRAALSLTNNLAEGHGRFHFLDQIRFTLINGYLRYLRDRKLGATMELRETPMPYGGMGEGDSMEWLEQFLAEFPDLVADSRAPITHSAI